MNKFLDITFSGILIAGLLVLGYVFIIAYCIRKAYKKP
jgi:hypothetical protein